MAEKRHSLKKTKGPLLCCLPLHVRELPILTESKQFKRENNSTKKTNATQRHSKERKYDMYGQISFKDAESLKVSELFWLLPKLILFLNFN